MSLRTNSSKRFKLQQAILLIAKKVIEYFKTLNLGAKSAYNLKSLEGSNQCCHSQGFVPTVEIFGQL